MLAFVSSPYYFLRFGLCTCLRLKVVTAPVVKENDYLLPERKKYHSSLPLNCSSHRFPIVTKTQTGLVYFCPVALKRHFFAFSRQLSAPVSIAKSYRSCLLTNCDRVQTLFSRLLALSRVELCLVACNSARLAQVFSGYQPGLLHHQCSERGASFLLMSSI